MPSKLLRKPPDMTTKAQRLLVVKQSAGLKTYPPAATKTHREKASTHSQIIEKTNLKKEQLP